jgi:hypothetical protein
MELFMCKECAHEISRAPTANQAVHVNRQFTCEITDEQTFQEDWELGQHLNQGE